MVYSLQFTQETVDSNKNPYGIVPLWRDVSLPKWQQEIFRYIDFKPTTWDAVGVSYLPKALLEEFGESSFTFHFKKTSCKSLDCFGIVSYEGQQCNPLDSSTETIYTPSGPIIACQHSCFYPGLDRPSNEYVYYDNERKICRRGLSLFRRFCVIPATRTNDAKRVPPLHWDEQNQICHVTKAYCEAQMGLMFSNNDCVLPRTQGAFEFLFGRNAVRTLIVSSGRDVDRATRIEIRHARIAAEIAKKHETVEQCGHTFVNMHRNLSLAVRMKSSDTSVFTDNKVAEFPELSAFESLLGTVGYALGVTLMHVLAKRVLIRLSETMFSVTSDVLQRLIADSMERSALKIGALLLARTTTRCAAEAAHSALVAFAKLLDPLTYAVDTVMILSMIWDALDDRYTKVISKSHLYKVQEALIKQFNKDHHILNNQKLGVVEVTPVAVYLRLYGSSLSTKSPLYSEKLLHTYFYFIEKYINALDIDHSSKLKFQSEHLNKFHESFNKGLVVNKILNPCLRIKPSLLAYLSLSGAAACSVVAFAASNDCVRSNALIIISCIAGMLTIIVLATVLQNLMPLKINECGRKYNVETLQQNSIKDSNIAL